MLEIKGKVNTAICYAKEIEDEAIEQIRRMCDYELTRGSRVRIMPDVHAGKGCTIGTTMTVTDKVCPNIVGVDIGCGMYTVRLKKTEIDFEKIDEACHFIPSGMNVWEGRIERFPLTELCCYRALRDSRRLERSLGTLGGGNHFVEIDRAKDGTNYLVIHSGSRNLGKQVAEYYQQLAIDLHMGKEEYFKEREEIIRTYKEAGRRSEIQSALGKLKRDYQVHALRVPEDISIVGFDDSLVCTLISPSLTTMRIQKKRIGELAVHRLHEIINGDKTAQVTLVNAELVVRETTAPPKR